MVKILSGDGSISFTQKFIQGLVPGNILTGKVLSVLQEGRAVVDFQGQNTVVQIAAPVKQGQQLTARVHQLHPFPVLKLLPQEPSVQGEKVSSTSNPALRPVQENDAEFSTQLSSKRIPPLKFLTSQDVQSLKLFPAQEVRGEVSRVMDARTVFIQVHGRELPVNTSGQIPLNTGELITARVKNVAGRAALVFQNEPTKSVSLDVKIIRPYLSSSQPYDVMINRLEKAVNNAPLLRKIKIDPELIGRIRETLDVMAHEKNRTPGSVRLREQVDLSGIRYEAKIKNLLTKPFPEKHPGITRDLKGQLLEFARQVDDLTKSGRIHTNFSRQASELAQFLRNAVDNIELNQLTQQLARQENGLHQLQIPNPFGPDGKSVKIYILHQEEDGKNGKRHQKGGFTMVFLLNLSMLGDLRLDTRVSGKDLTLDIKTPNKTISDFIESRIPEFREGMEKLGFHATVNCCAQEEIDLEVKNDLIQLLVEEATRLVDIKT